MTSIAWEPHCALLAGAWALAYAPGQKLSVRFGTAGASRAGRVMACIWVPPERLYNAGAASAGMINGGAAVLPTPAEMINKERKLGERRYVSYIYIWAVMILRPHPWFDRYREQSSMGHAIHLDSSRDVRMMRGAPWAASTVPGTAPPRWIPMPAPGRKQRVHSESGIDHCVYGLS